MKCPNCSFNVAKCFDCNKPFKRLTTVKCYLTISGLREHKHHNSYECEDKEAIFTFKGE